MARKIEVKRDTSPPESAPSTESKKPGRLRRNWKKLLLLVGVLILIGGIGYFAFQYNHARQEVRRLSNAQQAQQDETARIKAAVSQLAEIPNDETPTLATVTDVSRLQSQSFFKNAQNGDKVLVFTNAKKAHIVSAIDK